MPKRWRIKGVGSLREGEAREFTADGKPIGRFRLSRIKEVGKGILRIDFKRETPKRGDE